MVNKILFIFCLTLITLTTAVAQQGALDYLNELGAEYEKIKGDTWSYVKATAHGKAARKIEKRRGQLLETIRKSSYAIKKMKSFEGDPSLKTAAVTYLDLNYNVINEDYAKIVDLEAIAEESYDAMEAYINAKKAAREKLSLAYEILDSVQRTFAARYNIPIVDDMDKTSEKLDKAADVFDYYQEMYLIFFRSYKQEFYVFDALSRNDLSAFEQNRNSLSSYAKQGIEEFNKLGSYKNDPMLKLAGLQMMQFYKDESEKSLTEIADFLIAKNRFEQINKRMESMKESKRTKEDVDRYNAAVKEYNAQINNYSKVNDQLTKKRTALLNNWNEKVDTFLSKHVPK